MAGYKGHLSGALVAYIISIVLISHWYIVTPSLLLELLLFLSIGALFPDIDVPSKGRRLTVPLLCGVLIIGCFFNKWWLIVGALLVLCAAYTCRHRGFLHSKEFLVLLIGACLIGMPLVHNVSMMLDLLFFVIGFLSHRLLDGFRW